MPDALGDGRKYTISLHGIAIASLEETYVDWEDKVK
jgi:hypothetical protein